MDITGAIPNHYLLRQTIDEQAESLVQQYDRNGDGSIGSTEYTKGSIFSSSSIERLAVMADKLGTADGKTEAWEIANVMRAFDTGDDFANIFRHPTFPPGDDTAHDGYLTGSERTQFEDTIGPEKTELDFEPWYIDRPPHGVHEDDIRRIRPL
jgi:hypothetical protein